MRRQLFVEDSRTRRLPAFHMYIILYRVAGADELQLHIPTVPWHTSRVLTLFTTRNTTRAVCNNPRLTGK